MYRNTLMRNKKQGILTELENTVKSLNAGDSLGTNGPDLPGQSCEKDDGPKL